MLFRSDFHGDEFAANEGVNAMTEAGVGGIDMGHCDGHIDARPQQAAGDFADALALQVLRQHSVLRGYLN